jgi:predicted HNH restriction endonuclease
MASWIDDIVQSMKNLGGQAEYEELYEEVRRIRDQPLPKTWKAIIRNQVESHSSDSDNYEEGRTDYFFSVYGKGQGVWALRRRYQEESSSDSKSKEPDEKYRVESTEVTLTRYERDSEAREECLQRYGHSCFVCDFDFEGYYGSIGKEFIHVHHLTPVSQLDDDYEVDPIQDLRPVCPNCHAMLHQEDPPITIERLQQIIESQ